MRRETARLKPDRLIWLLLLALLAERLALFAQLGPDYMSYSDDMAYVESGLYFARSGVISIWGEYPSAMIMPGMPVLIGLVSLLFPSLPSLLPALKLLWIVMGVLTAYVAYRTLSLLGSPRGGLVAAAWFLVPNMAWMNHVILTETPYMLFLSLCVYYTFRMAQGRDTRAFLGYVLSFLGALAFRGNILPWALLSWGYLLLRPGRDLRLLLRRALLLGVALALLLLPWGLRNQRLFGEFLPLGYGAGNPLLLGTYQGEGYPADEELDYETHVRQVMHARFPERYKDSPEPWSDAERDYYREKFDPEGEVKELGQAQYLSLTADGLKARYRLREWWARAPGSLLKSYLYIKPRWMLNWSWCWEAPFGIAYPVFHRISQINLLLCAASVLLAFCKKRARAPMLFLSGAYALNVYITAAAFVTDRYASTLVILRYLIVGLGAALLFAPGGGRTARERKEIHEENR